MRKKVLFIHGGGAQGIHEGSNDLVNYLREMLGSAYKVLYPKMPDPESPEYESWKALLAKEIASLQGELFLIGHSLGGSVLLKYLSEETCSKSIAGLFLIAAPYWGKKNWQVEEYILQENFSARLPPISRIFLYHSLNDKVVPVSHLRSYAEKLPTALIRETGDLRHLFSKGLPQLVEDIKRINAK